VSIERSLDRAKGVVGVGARNSSLSGDIAGCAGFGASRRDTVPLRAMECAGSPVVGESWHSRKISMFNPAKVLLSLSILFAAGTGVAVGCGGGAGDDACIPGDDCTCADETSCSDECDGKGCA
jgi:hypothetical protein